MIVLSGAYFGLIATLGQIPTFMALGGALEDQGKLFTFFVLEVLVFLFALTAIGFVFLKRWPGWVGGALSVLWLWSNAGKGQASLSIGIVALLLSFLSLVAISHLERNDEEKKH